MTEERKLQIFKKKNQNLRWREEAEIIQLHSYCQQNKNTEDKERKQKLFSYALIVHKTIYTRQREKAINIQLRPYCQTQNPSSSHTQKLIPKKQYFVLN